MVVRVSVISVIALLLAGCSLVHREAAGVDAGPPDVQVAVVVLDAGPPPPVPPENVNQVGRFPDEVSLNDTVVKVADPNVSARNSVPGGALVATLRMGEPVTQVAKHESFILCQFPDPKNPSRTLEGWVAEQAFVPGPTVPSKTACPTGQTRLMFDEQDFCGHVCKIESDCPSGQVCSGKASLYASGKVGAEVTTCTIPASGAPPVASAVPSALPLPSALPPLGATTGAPFAGTRIVPGVQMPPFAGNTCLPGYVFGDKGLCHRDCSRTPCPGGARCARGIGAMYCEAM